MSIDRAALIEAALIALNNGESGYQVTRGIIDDRDASAVLDAVLPLIADAIEARATAECSERYDPVTAVVYERHDWGVPPPHYPDGRPGHPCEGCDAAEASDHAWRSAARLVRGLATRTGDDG